MNPDNGSGEPKRRCSRTKPGKDQKNVNNGSVVHRVLNPNFEGEFVTPKADADDEETDFDPVPQLVDKPPLWMQEPVGDLYPLPSFSAAPENLPRRAGKLHSSMMASQMDSCFANLRCLACSGGATRFLTCMKELLSLETKWRREFGEHGLHPVCGGGEAIDEGSQVCGGSSPLTVNGFPVEAFHTRRRKHSTPTRHPVWDLSPVDIAQSAVFNQHGAEFIDRTTWFYE